MRRISFSHRRVGFNEKSGRKNEKEEEEEEGKRNRLEKKGGKALVTRKILL